MLAYLVKRLGLAVLVALTVSVIAYMLLYLSESSFNGFSLLFFEIGLIDQFSQFCLSLPFVLIFLVLCKPIA